MSKIGKYWNLIWIVILILVVSSTINSCAKKELIHNTTEQNTLQSRVQHDPYKYSIYNKIQEEEQKKENSHRKHENNPREKNLREPSRQLNEQLQYVSFVIDGDTIGLDGGETVRLVGLNAPEIGERCSSEAKNKLSSLVLGKEIVLEEDVDKKDQYGRLLRYVHVGGVFVNLELVKLGFAHKYEYGDNTKYSSKFEEAEQEAKINEGCLWKKSKESYIQDKCIYVSYFHYDAEGNDNFNLNDEFVVFGNKCSYSINMNGWTVKDNTASHLYVFLDFTFKSGGIFALYTGIGDDTSSSLYWNRNSGNYAAIWNNAGDTLFLRNQNGDLVLTENY